jgi:hypothetical protein
MMAKEGDIDIRYDGVSAGAGLLIMGLVLCVVGGGVVYMAWSISADMGKHALASPRAIDAFTIGSCFGGVLGIGGTVMALFGISRMFDNSVKLSLTAEGIKDHRTAVLVRWADLRGSILLRQSRSGAAMSVSVASAGGQQEIWFDLSNLERKPHEILRLVEQRANAAHQAAFDGPEAAMEGLMDEVLTDLESGIPLSFAVNKLVKRGFEPGVASAVVRAAAGDETAHCGKCALEYHASIDTCTNCNGKLSRRAAP